MVVHDKALVYMSENIKDITKLMKKGKLNGNMIRGVLGMISNFIGFIMRYATIAFNWVVG